MHRIYVIGMILAFGVTGCSGRTSRPTGSSETAALVPLSQLPAVDTAGVLEHVKVLSSDAYGGRRPGTKGEDLTVQYITEAFKSAGIQPGAADGTYIQRVPLVGITPAPTPLVVQGRNGRVALEWKKDMVGFTRHVASTAAATNAELVFVGYGVQAPEFGWDDFKGVDVKGKAVVVLINDPPVPDPAEPSRLDPKVFGGDAMSYYGRWTYKYDTAAAKGAACVFIVHETGPAGYPFAVIERMGDERWNLVAPDKDMSRPAVEGWITADAARRVFKLAGKDFDELKRQAVTRTFRPVAMGITASMALRNTLRTIESRNVIGKVQGADPAVRDEAVVYSAHWDHSGTTEEGIFHGARDNAVGVGSLIELGRAFAHVSPAPKRTVVFLSITAEEQGLLGSEYYVTHPAYPLARTLADINMEDLNVHGRTRDVTVVGLGLSDLDDYTKAAAAEQRRAIAADPDAAKGVYYRSDHFSFARAGVPGLFLKPGNDFIGKPHEYGPRVRNDFYEHDYHRPTDTVKADWDLSGAAEDLKLLFAVGYRLADASRYPAWKPGTEFKPARDAMLADRR
jgi:Zn-dependent M28 family amino/carboxypeptidase